MKLIIRDYLASLKERDELDAVLPDLLSGIGFTVYSRPGRGTTQNGVDIAAVGKDEDGERKVFLFSVKQGDLTRQNWDAPVQGLRSSLNEILDAYLPTRIPARYKKLKVVICLCFGGDVQEQVRDKVTGYINENSTDRISFAEWNGDKMAELLLQGILREEILPSPLRSSFRKAVAMVDEPTVAYQHFLALSQQLHQTGSVSPDARVTAARQLNICLWILFVWARDNDNLEAPYRCSEQAVIIVWDLLRPFINKKNNLAKAMTTALHQIIQLHTIIAGQFLEGKIFPHVDKRHALSMAVESRSSVDINIRLFDLLGRIAMTGLWLFWFTSYNGREISSDEQEKLAKWVVNGFKLIQSNPALFLPVSDQQAIEIALFLLLMAAIDACSTDALNWLREMTNRLDLTLHAHGNYPCIHTDYRDLLGHPKAQTDEYRVEATSGSILIPLIASWLAAFNQRDALQKLVNLKQTLLAHCTLQLWLPDNLTEERFYVGRRDHGVALCDLPLSSTGDELLSMISEACQKEDGFTKLSPNTTGYWPILLLACRHFRMPVPPQFWIDVVKKPDGKSNVPSQSPRQSKRGSS